MTTLTREIAKRAHSVEPQGGRVYMVLIRMDEIIAAVRKFRRKRRKQK